KQRDAIFAAWLKSLSDPEAHAIQASIAAEWKKHPIGQTSVLSVAERPSDDVRRTKTLDRGEWDRPKHVAQPSVPAFLHTMQKNAGAPTRLDFARWLVDKRSPLAARVQVNRVWQALFGIGLVETAED